MEQQTNINAEIIEKARKWDALGEKIAKCYNDYDEEGNELKSEFEEENGEEADLTVIGEMAAHAFGWL